MVLGGDAIPMTDERGERLLDDGLLILMNAHHEPISFKLPAEAEGGPWLLELDSGDPDKAAGTPCAGAYEVAGRALAVLRQPLDQTVAREAAAAPARVVKKEAQRRRRRAGILLPLFSIRSASDGGIGDIPDIARFAPWASRAGFSVLQLLPVNRASPADPSPYAAQSAFALDPVYLSLDACEDFAAAGGRDALPDDVKQRIAAAAAAPRVDWPAVRAVKDAGIAVAFQRFLRDEWGKQSGRAKQLAAFMRENRDWLDDYTLYAVLHRQTNKGWLDWPRGAREREPGTLAGLRREHANDLLREAWLQWQLDRQWRKARRDASAAGVELMGDLPFVVGLDSADVWANRALFRLDERLGTPPDEGAPDGHDWGLPVYDWDAMERDDFSWIRRRAKRAGELYGLYRVDHALGCYRTYSRSTDGRQSGFSPPETQDQIQRGERLMRMMSRFGEVIAEDLGALPDYLRPSLERIGVAGYRVLRWEREGQDGRDFRDPASWPEISVATNATHDTDTTADWYDALSPEDRERLRRIPALAGLDPAAPFGPAVRDALLRAVYAAPSTLTLVTLEDLLGGRGRINDPGTPEGNWTYRAPATIDELAADEELTARLATLASETGRAPAR
jgi:4-alpha-glucanotransferase